MNQPAIISPPPYLRCPEAIYQESFQQIDALVDYSPFPKNLHSVLRRLIHAVGRPEIADVFCFSQGWHDDAFLTKIKATHLIFTDSEMTRSGIIKKNLPEKMHVECTINQPNIATMAQKQSTTRSAIAVDLWQAEPQQSIAVIGNAPTALFHLLNNIQHQKILPLCVIAFPVGFVGAAESKDFLMKHQEIWGFEWLTLKGREGGSALAAAAINALFAENS